MRKFWLLNSVATAVIVAQSTAASGHAVWLAQRTGDLAIV